MKTESTPNKTQVITSTPHIISRVDWGAQPPLGDFKLHQPKRITLHHGGVFKDPETVTMAYLKRLQIWGKREKSWPDIPYHYIVDMKGLIYEARPDNTTGDTNTEYDPTDHLLINLMGNYQEQIPIQDQIDSIVELMAYLCRRYQVSPKTIASHKDYSTMTSCPGKNLYPYIENGYFKKEVSALLQKEGYLEAIEAANNPEEIEPEKQQ